MKITTSVTQFPMGASVFGVQDLMGNTQEWVDEWEPQAARQPSMRVTKGGGRGFPAQGLQCWLRQFTAPLTRNANIGFRCVKDVS